MHLYNHRVDPRSHWQLNRVPPCHSSRWQISSNYLFGSSLPINCIVHNHSVTKNIEYVQIHGFPDLSMGWRYQIPTLLNLGLRVVAPDCMGYGRTVCNLSSLHCMMWLLLTIYSKLQNLTRSLPGAMAIGNVLRTWESLRASWGPRKLFLEGMIGKVFIFCLQSSSMASTNSYQGWCHCLSHCSLWARLRYLRIFSLYPLLATLEAISITWTDHCKNTLLWLSGPAYQCWIRRHNPVKGGHSSIFKRHVWWKDNRRQTSNKISMEKGVLLEKLPGVQPTPLLSDEVSIPRFPSQKVFSRSNSV